MIKSKLNLLVICTALLMSSCIIKSYHTTTGNPIGKKEGFVKSKSFANSDAGIGAAAKKGGITKIGSVDVKFYLSGKISVKVTGE